MYREKAYNPLSKLQQPLIAVNNGFKPFFFCWTYRLGILALNKIRVALCKNNQNHSTNNFNTGCKESGASVMCDSESDIDDKGRQKQNKTFAIKITYRNKVWDMLGMELGLGREERNSGNMKMSKT
ncbi:hypothetical protein BTVI_63557 [Pitangus sulphuratus]|nr:hypothetical protein BTVI_63557 [Pitangus sulphuratus]